jgi:hypothetical protein
LCNADLSFLQFRNFKIQSFKILKFQKFEIKFPFIVINF